MEAEGTERAREGQRNSAQCKDYFSEFSNTYNTPCDHTGPFDFLI